MVKYAASWKAYEPKDEKTKKKMSAGAKANWRLRKLFKKHKCEDCGIYS